MGQPVVPGSTGARVEQRGQVTSVELTLTVAALAFHARTGPSSTKPGTSTKCSSGTKRHATASAQQISSRSRPRPSRLPTAMDSTASSARTGVRCESMMFKSTGCSVMQSSAFSGRRSRGRPAGPGRRVRKAAGGGAAFELTRHGDAPRRTSAARYQRRPSPRSGGPTRARAPAVHREAALRPRGSTGLARRSERA